MSTASHRLAGRNVSASIRTPHAIITGKTGSGKSNILTTLITSLAYNYGPDQVKIDLLDYKMGLECGRYAAQPYLPHARLVGENINQDPEFGIAALENLSHTIDGGT